MTDLISNFNNLTINTIPKEILKNFETYIINNIKKTTSKPGSLRHLFCGDQPSEQSIFIQIGKMAEKELFIKLIKSNNDLEILNCGIQEIGNSRKDIDLLWSDGDTIYYRECKSNMELDTEKLPAMIEKIKFISYELQNQYSDKKIDSGILHWSVYDNNSENIAKNHIKRCNDKDIKVDHVKDFLDIVNYTWSKDEFIKYFRNLYLKIIKN